MLTLTRRLVLHIPRCTPIRTYASRAAAGGTQAPGAYCADVVRRHDYEGFLCAPFYAPGAPRAGFLALKAFQIELAGVYDAVSSPLVGRMRMQFWRDAVASVAEGKPVRHPIALALHDANQHARLPVHLFRRIIDAREAELANPAHMTVDDFTAHAEATTASLHHLLLALLDLGGAPASAAPLTEPHVHASGHAPLDPAALAHAASHLGVAGAIATRLRALPFHAARRRSVLPAELAAGHVRDEDLFRLGGAAPGVRDAVYAFACVAHAHLGAARETFEVDGVAGRVPPRALPVFMAGVPVAAFLARLEAANFDAFAPGLARRNWRLPWQMWRASYSRQF